MQLRDAIERAGPVRERLALLETRRHGRPWNVEEIALGFVGDVGALREVERATAE